MAEFKVDSVHYHYSKTSGKLEVWCFNDDKAYSAKNKKLVARYDFGRKPNDESGSATDKKESVLSTFMRKIVCRQLKKELLCNGGIAESGLQMLHVHVFLVAPLGACDMAQAGADEHQSGVAVGEGTHNPGTPPDLAV